MTQPATSTDRRPPVPGGRRYLATVVTVPVLVVAVGTGLLAAAWPRLPAVVASHWGPTGVDGTQGRVAFAVSAAAVVLGVSLLLAAAAWVLPGDGRRLMAALVALMSGFLGTVLYGALVGQGGVVETSAATLSPWLFPLGVLLGALLGGIAWVLNPVVTRPDPVPAAVPPGTPRLPRAEGERLAWFGWTASGRWVSWVAVGLAALGCLVAVLAAPWAALGPALGVVLVLLVAHARVVVDVDALTVTSAGVVRWLRVPLESVAYAERSELHAFHEFGGFGLRFRAGERAFVTRTGDALRIVQRDGTRTYVSMDDPDEAAAVVNALVAPGVDA